MTSTIDVRGVQYAFEETGRGPLVLFGHSMCFDKSMFRAQADALSDRFRCVRVDWPGHGGSGWRRDGWTVWDLVDDIAQIASLLGHPRFILVGISQGAGVFARVAARFPDRVRALALMAANPNAFAPEATARLAEQSSILASGDAERIDALFGAIVERNLSPATISARPDVLEQAKAILHGHDPAGLSLAVRLPASYDTLSDHLNLIRATTLVAWGRDDRAVPIASVDRYRDCLRDMRFVEIRDAGHALPIEQPERLAAVLDDFLSPFAEHH